VGGLCNQGGLILIGENRGLLQSELHVTREVPKKENYMDNLTGAGVNGRDGWSSGQGGGGGETFQQAKGGFRVSI